MASEITVQTIKGPTSGANANKILIPSGQTLSAPGHVVQVVDRTGGGRVTSGNTGTWTPTNMDLSITPKFANSKILVIGNQPMRIYGVGVTVARGSQRIKRNVAGGSYTVIWNNAGHQEHIQVRLANSVTQELSHVVSWSVLDAPSYSLGDTLSYVPEGYMYGDTGVSQLILWEGTRGATIQLMEIAQ